MARTVRPWLRRKTLFEVAERTLGHTPEMRTEYLEIEKCVDRLWEVGEREFGWYNNPLYVYNCVNCFCDFSKGYTRYFAKWVNENLALYDKRLNEVLDYGCGIGASSRLFEEDTGIGVIAHCYGDDIVPQYKVASALLNQPGTHSFPLVSLAPPEHLQWDGVMAFELFEHEYEPLKLWDQLTVKNHKQDAPWVVCEASSFGTEFKYGHFPEYRVDGVEVPRKQMPRVWKHEIEDRGWTLAESGWNGRPHIWVRL